MVIGKVKEGGAKYIETKPGCKKSVSDENAVRAHCIWGETLFELLELEFCVKGTGLKTTHFAVVYI